MPMLLLGLALFLGAHAFTQFRAPRARLLERLGPGPYRIAYSLLATSGLVLIAMGFTGPGGEALTEGLWVTRHRRGTIEHAATWETSAPGVFTAGDCARGQSLIVWAIAEGRAAAAAVDAHLMGSSALPVPVHPSASPITL